AGLPVSTSQAIVGAIIGWNLFSGFPTDTASLIKIVGTWIACPLIAGVLGVLIFKVTTVVVRWARLHIYRLDAYTRLGLILAGAFGSYSLGANNIANVMGVFVSANPFTTFNLGDLFAFTGIQQLFLLGAIAIGVGVYTYSKKVMLTVGGGLLPLSPVAAWVVVVAHSIVLFMFASQGLEHALANAGLPTIPLVPVSSSQAVVGAVIGIGLLKGGRGIKWRVLANIASGWVTTPLVACLVCFVALFFLQNVFNQQVYRDASYVLSQPVLDRLEADDIEVKALVRLKDQRFDTVRGFRKALRERMDLREEVESKILSRARISPILINNSKIWQLDNTSLTKGQVSSMWPLVGRKFDHLWMLDDALADASEEWRSKPPTKLNKLFNRHLEAQRREVYGVFQLELPQPE
ncbi:MAG: inorganic phosphate transporter, partial [Gammaproteobacteria bacterium]|nr:inorganic phosphate transporter [Gammaproteobacteria bacterium]